MGTIVAVQRLLASIVLSVIGLLPFSGALSSIGTHAPQLPPCCRAHGKHECAMRVLQHAHANANAERGIYPVCGRYPLTPPASLVAANAWVFPPKQSGLFDADVVTHRTVRLQGEAPYSGCFERGHLTRGPPTFLS